MKKKHIDDLIGLIREIYKTKKIVLHEPRFIGKEKKNLIQTIDSTFVSSSGENINLFEKKIAKITGSKYAISTSSGTAALHSSLIAVGCDSNSEVITQSLSFIAACNAIKYCGSHPIFIDVDRDSFGLSPSKLEKFLSENTEVRSDKLCWNKKTNRIIKACIPMHTFGFMMQVDKIKKICRKFNIKLIEDAAEALGSFYKKKHAGTFGDIGVISFNGNKIITTGAGGMIITNNKKYADKLKHLTTTAKKLHPWHFIHDMVGYNYRMPNLCASLGLAQLENLKFFLNDKKDLAHIYYQWGKENDFNFLRGISNCHPNYWLNTIILNNKSERDRLLEETNKKGIITRPVWTPVHKLKMYRTYSRDDMLNTNWIFNRAVSLPSSVRLKASK